MADDASAGSLDLEPKVLSAMGDQVLRRIVGLQERLPDRPARPAVAQVGNLRDRWEVPAEEPGVLEELLDTLDQAARGAWAFDSPRAMAFVPSGGLPVSALGEWYARSANAYGGVAYTSIEFATIEEGVLGWIARDVCGLPEGSGGILTTGGSLANFSAVVAAREASLGPDIGRGTLYLTEYAHRSITKAARLAGISPEHIRVVPSTGLLTMDLAAAEAMIIEDQRQGLQPFLIVGTAGTTDTGAVDPLPSLAALARRRGLWFHVDAAYGGFFRLTERGRQLLSGMEDADSVTLDPHKSLFLPFGTGALVVRDPATLRAAFSDKGHYQQDYVDTDALPDYSALGPELSREVRGVRVWLPLRLHGVAAFRAALDEKMDLAAAAHRALSAAPELELPTDVGLSTLTFRVRPSSSSRTAADQADLATRRLLDHIAAEGRYMLSSTTVNGQFLGRICILAHRTHAEHVEGLVSAITTAAKTISGMPSPVR
ncbi:amino acid decarboxylase [Actinoplanes sp. TBRC 11911]|uniref:pyridoxal phosphate-dependent decarboxylase family protein n=1 Tax=Actinoplanes sp. TBRC 11911 TaxID=2729386 RepID=UPI00145CFF9C|nr:pyridoxal-dependent decarboxylase [Actinoplanes sp. TBRC 11911]NMO50993.1 amino acid decarboxylase [Actinoplanes sp. TBRC 11911]